MPLLIQCPKCRVSTSVADTYVGQTVKCRKCNTSFKAKQTADGDKSDTKGSSPSLPGDPFPSLPAEFGRYRALRKLGQGGMGAVYLAQDSQLGRQVALKLPNFSATETMRVERFVREAKSAAGLMHPHICPVFDAGTIDGRPFITMAFIPGKPLEDSIDPDSPMEPRSAVEIVRKVASALQEAHEKGIVHRDLKPANVMINTKGEPVVMDFGLAKRVAEVDPHEEKLTRDGAVMGTPSYMAPEQVKGEQDKIGPATDVYALGVMLFEMLTGQTPYRGTLGVVMGQILTSPVPPLSEFRPGIDSRLDAACKKAMAKEIKDRFADMQSFSKVLADCLVAPAEPKPAPVAATPFDELVAEESPAIVKPSTAGQRGKPRSRSPLLLAAGLLGLLVAAAGVVLTFKTKHGDVVIEIDDPKAKVEVKVDGDLVDIAGLDKPLSLKVGEHGLTVSGADFETVTRQFTVKQEDKAVVKVALKPKPGVASKQPVEGSVRLTPYTNSIGMVFVPVPKGKSWLGGGGGKFGDKEVEIKQDFFLGKYPVTQEEWETIMGANPSHFSRNGKGKASVKDISDADLKRFPVETVTWDDCKEFIAKLNDKTRESGWIYRLPTEIEWEYACRGGPMADRVDSTFDYYFEKPVNSLLPTQANFGKGDGGRPNRVDAFLPNTLGLQEMHGNVHQLCIPAPGSSAVDSIAVLKGGSFWSPPHYCTAGSFIPGPAKKGTDKSEFRWSKNTGLRLARVPGEAVRAPVPPSSPPAPKPATDRKPNQIVAGDWRIEGKELVQSANGRNLIFFGDRNWTDYDFSFETKTDAKGFGAPQGGVALVRAEGHDRNHYGFVLGAYGGTFNELSMNFNGRFVRDVNPLPFNFEADRWYRVKVSVRGSKIACELDGKPLFDHSDARHSKGPVGLASINSIVRFRDIKVTAADGTVLWDGLPDVPAATPDVPAAPAKPNKPVTDLKSARREGGDWKIVGKELVQTKPGLAAILFGDKEWTDYDFFFETKTDGPEEKLVDGGVAVYRAQDFGNLHSLVVGAYKGTFMEVCRWQDSNWNREINPIGKAYYANGWHKVLVKARGDRFICLVDDQILFDYRDPKFAKGSVGLRTWAPNARFRNIKVVDPNGTVLWDGLPDVPPDPFDRKPTLLEAGDWKIEARDLVQGKAENAKLFLGDKNWTDYDFTFEAKTDAAPGSGAVGGRVLFRATDPNNLHRFSVNAEGGKVHDVSRFDNGTINKGRPSVPSEIGIDKWYKVLVRVRGENIHCEIDGKTVFDYKDPLQPKGQVGLTTWNAPCRWRDIRVTAPDGKVLWEGLPDLEPAVPEKQPAPKTNGFLPLFNGKDLKGWKVDAGAGKADQWTVKDGVITAASVNYVTRNYLLTEADYSDFALRFEFQVGDALAHGGVSLRAIPGEQVPSLNGKSLFDHPMIKLTHPDRGADGTGAAHWLRSASQNTTAFTPPAVTVGKWHKMEISLRGETCNATIDGKPLDDLKYDPTAPPSGNFVPGLKRAKGKVGFQINRGPMLYRNIEIKPLGDPDPFQEKTVWVGGTGSPTMTLTVTERKGEAFKARLQIGTGIEREITGTAKDGKITWLAKDVKAVKGTVGGDNTGTIAKDKDGDRIDFEWTQGTAKGTFTLRMRPGK